MKMLTSHTVLELVPAAGKEQAPAAAGEDRGRGGLWGGWPAAALLVAAAYGIFHYGYEPARAERTAVEGELRTAAARQTDKQRRLSAMREKCAELEHGDPETIAEVIRQELNKGAADEYFK